MNLSQLDLASISRALDDHDPDREHFLLVEEGTVWTFVFSEATDETRERRAVLLERPPREVIRIPARSPQAEFEEIEDFVESVEDPDVREKLFTALERKGALRNFREAVLGHSEEHRRWRSARKEASRLRLEAFLKTLGVEAVPAGNAAPE